MSSHIFSRLSQASSTAEQTQKRTYFPAAYARPLLQRHSDAESFRSAQLLLRLERRRQMSLCWAQS
jgi:hypothetical protein